MHRGPVPAVEARAAIVQLRSLLVADAPIEEAEARRLAELAAEFVPDNMHPQKVAEIAGLSDKDPVSGA